MGADIALEGRKRDSHMAGDRLMGFRKQKPLLMDRQQHIELPARNAIQDEGEIAVRVGPQRRAPMKLAHEPGKAPEAMRVRVAHLHMVPAKAQCGDGFAR